MHKTKAAIVGILALIAGLSPVIAQQFPTVPDRSVIGRIGVGGQSGPSQAIPFASFLPNLVGTQSINTVFAGPGSGSSGLASFRALVGADLPNIFTKDTLFKSGRPWADVTAYGALADASTDNATAFTNAIAAVAALGGGMVFVPPAINIYCIKSQVTVSQNVWIVGPASSSASQISTCGADVTLFNLTGSRSGLQHLNLLGKGLPVPGDVTFGASHETIKVSTGAVQASLINLNVQGGTIPIRVDEVDVFAQDVHVANFYGNAMLYITKGGWYQRLQLDGIWPFTLPTAGHAAILAWQAAHGYTAGDVVTLVCPGGLGLNMYIQAMTTGTSGGSAPTCKNYALTFTDNTTSWQVATPVLGSNIQIDGSAVPGEIQISQLDAGSAENGISITNSAMRHVKISQAVISGTVKNAINAQNGDDLTVISSEIFGGFVTTGTGVNFASTWTGEGRIANSLIWSGQYEVFIGGGTNTIITGNGLYGATTAAVGVAANVTNFSINGNGFGPSVNYGTNAAGVIVAAGTSDAYTITGNYGSGAGVSITDGGSGLNKTVIGIGTPNPLTFSVTVAVNLSNVAYNIGPTISQGSAGTWYASGTATITSTIGDAIVCRLTDGTNLIDSTQFNVAASGTTSTHLSGIRAAPAGNLRIECENVAGARGTIAPTNGADQKASTISAFRIQ